MCLGVKQLAQYCETGGAVDSMKEVFIINCLFLYRSNGNANGKHLTHVVVLHVISDEAEERVSKWL